MTHAIIKNNINRLLKEKNWKISEAEKRLGSSRALTSILRDKSKNPTIEVLESIANAFNVDIEEIITEPALTGKTNVKLFKNVCCTVLDEIDKSEYFSPSYVSIISIIKEIYEYSMHLNLEEADTNFVKWTISKYYNCREINN
jgi:transcriptional regulator with XRE-family HTH domain